MGGGSVCLSRPWCQPEQRALLLCCPVSPQVRATFKTGSGLLLRKPEVFSECKQRCSCSGYREVPGGLCVP